MAGTGSAGSARSAGSAGSAGYSTTPLPRKLGIKAGHRVLLVGARDDRDLDLGPLPDDVIVTRRARVPRAGRYDVVLLFCPDTATLVAGFEPASRRLDPSSTSQALWACWLKKSSGVPSDLGESGVHAHGLAVGLVDVKVCAVDERWSAFKFVYRVSDRPKASSTQAKTSAS